MKKHHATIKRVYVVNFASAFTEMERDIKYVKLDVWDSDSTDKRTEKARLKEKRQGYEDHLAKMHALQKQATEQPVFLGSASEVPRSLVPRNFMTPYPLDERPWFFYVLFHDYLYQVVGPYTQKEFGLLVLDEFDRERKLFERIQPVHNDDAPTSRRERIPENVRIFVWRRDGGKCARCESREKLEYDHIVPVSRGGGNTARNVELLCEACNRSKGNNIA